MLSVRCPLDGVQKGMQLLPMKLTDNQASLTPAPSALGKGDFFREVQEVL